MQATKILMIVFFQICVLGDDQVCRGLQLLPDRVHGDVHDSFLRAGGLQYQLPWRIWQGDTFVKDMVRNQLTYFLKVLVMMTGEFEYVELMYPETENIMKQNDTWSKINDANNEINYNISSLKQRY